MQNECIGKMTSVTLMLTLSITFQESKNTL